MEHVIRQNCETGTGKQLRQEMMIIVRKLTKSGANDNFFKKGGGGLIPHSTSPYSSC